MATKRLTLSVPEEIIPMLETLAGGERQKGQWIATVVRTAYEGHQTPQANDLEAMQLQIIGLNAKLNGVQTELRELKSQLQRVQ